MIAEEIIKMLPCTGIPSRHQDSVAGGLLEAASQNNVASTSGFNSSGSTRTLTVSGATVKIQNKFFCFKKQLELAGSSYNVPQKFQFSLVFE